MMDLTDGRTASCPYAPLSASDDGSNFYLTTAVDENVSASAFKVQDEAYPAGLSVL